MALISPLYTFIHPANSDRAPESGLYLAQVCVLADRYGFGVEMLDAVFDLKVGDSAIVGGCTIQRTENA